MFVSLKNANLRQLFLATVLIFVSFSVLMPTLPVYLHERGANHFVVGVVVGAFPVGVLLFRAVAGWLVSRVGRRNSLLGSVVLALLVPAAYQLAHSDWFLLPVRILHGALLSVFTTATLVYVADVARPERRGAAISEMGVANYIGIAAGPALAEALYRPADLRGVLAVMAAATFLGLLSVRGVREVTGVRDAVRGEEESRRWLTPGVMVASLVFFLGAVGHGAAFTFVPLLVKENGLGSSGAFFATFAVFTLLIRTLGKDLPDRFGRVRLSALSLVAFSGVLSMLALASSQFWVLAAGALYGLVFGVFQPALTALVADMTTYRTRGPVFGVFLGAFDGGFIVAGVVLGHVADLLGIRAMLLLSAGAPLVGALVLAGIARRTRSSLRSEEPGATRETEPLLLEDVSPAGSSA